MTRINSAIPVANLTDEHLLAEHREIKRIPYYTRKGTYRHGYLPKVFTLGRGHVLFFTNKNRFIYNRYLEIYYECIFRGFNVTSYHHLWEGLPQDSFKDHTPTDEERSLLIERISERINQSTKGLFHYCGKRIDKLDAIKLLKTGKITKHII